VRRISAILLLVAFSLPLIAAPLQDSDANLPACCRRAGLHHCGGVRHSDPSDGSNKLNGRACPFLPSVAGISGPTQAILPGAISSVAALDPEGRPLAEYVLTHIISSRSHSHYKRGPPR